jgi:SOS response regulatory protein OraA/RecX
MNSPDPDPLSMSDAALRCAMNACQGSQWLSDRQFAEACRSEIRRRQVLARGPDPQHASPKAKEAA